MARPMRGDVSAIGRVLSAWVSTLLGRIHRGGVTVQRALGPVATFVDGEGRSAVSLTSFLLAAARTVAVRAAIGVIVWVTLVILAWLSRAGTAWNTALASGLGALTLQLVLQAAVGRTTAAAFMFAGVFFAEVAL